MTAATFDELKEAIAGAYPALPKQLQRIARFALDKPDELALGTVAAVAESAGVQPSAMIRFANALDYAGFSQMQQVFRGHLVERSTSYRDRITQLRKSGRPSGEGRVLHQFVGDAIAELGQLDDNIRAADLHAAVMLLCRAERVHLLAQRRAFPIAAYLTYALGQLELRTQQRFAGKITIDAILGFLETQALGLAHGLDGRDEVPFIEQGHRLQRQGLELRIGVHQTDLLPKPRGDAGNVKPSRRLTMNTLAEPQLNATPLIDVLLVLLVMIIFTLPVASHSVKLNLPQRAPQPLSAVVTPPIIVDVDFDGQLYWNGAPLPRDGVERKLREIGASSPEQRVKIVPDKRVRYENVAQLLAAAQRSGVTRLEVAPVQF